MSSNASSNVDARRLFFAIVIPPVEALTDVHKTLERWSDTLRRVSSTHWHLTLRFLGDVEVERVADVCQAGREAAAASVPSRIALRGIGTFRQRGRPSVLWVGVEQADGLVSLAGRLNANLVPLGFPTESRPLNPHLTLARFRGPASRQLLRWIDDNRTTDLGDAACETLELIRSELTPRGPIYTTLERFPLGQPSSPKVPGDPSARGDEC